MLLYIITTSLTILAQQPPDIWHDPNALALLGIGAGILGAIATVGAAVYTVRQGRTKRKIDYQVVSDTPIVAVNSTVAGKVQVLFNGQPAEETRVIVLKIRNIGNSSIRKEDYFEPLIFQFETDVISADVLETEPSTLLSSQERKNFLILGPQNVQLPQFPLNRHDTLTMTILLKEKSAVKALGRLNQGTITTPYHPRKLSKTARNVLTIDAFVGAVIAVVANVVLPNTIVPVVIGLIFLIAVMPLCISIILSAFNVVKLGLDD